MFSTMGAMIAASVYLVTLLLIGLVGSITVMNADDNRYSPNQDYFHYYKEQPKYEPVSNLDNSQLLLHSATNYITKPINGNYLVLPAKKSDYNEGQLRDRDIVLYDIDHSNRHNRFQFEDNYERHNHDGESGENLAESQHLHERTELFGGTKHKGKKEVHYHKHKHVHEHNHKQEHVHKHKQEHIHGHKHGHKHGNQHQHQHHGVHEHGHQHNSHHEHTGHHQHAHQNDHKHEHKQEHQHGHQHGHKHEHKQDHKHDHEHHGGHEHDHHHGHSHHHGHDHKEDHKHSHDHNGQHKHSHHHKHGHHGQHNHKHGHKHHHHKHH